MLESEFEEHMGNSYYERDDERTNYRNGYKNKTVKSSRGPIELSIPQDRNSTFTPEIV